MILHPSQEVILSPLREVIGVGQVTEAGGVLVELLAIEIRDAGALVHLRARAPEHVSLMFAVVSVSDDRGTPYRTLDAGQDGGSTWDGTTVVLPAPPPGARLRVEVLSFSPPRDHPGQRISPFAMVVGPWCFDVASPVG